MAGWARRLQLLGALLLMIAPFLAWAQARVLGVNLGLPGLFLHGSIALALGMLLCLGLLLGVRAPGVAILAALGSAAGTALDLQWILHRTEYVLRRLQLSLADLNNVLAQLNLQPVELFTREASQWAHVGVGVWVALGGSAIVVLGGVLEALGTPGKSPLSVLLGFPRCRGCGHRVEWAMSFCPGCGVGQASMQKACPGCHRPLKAGFRFCPDCGQSLSLEAGVGDKMIGSARV